MTTPLVSVIIVTRDVERYLAEAIQSILGQSFSDFELIIADFGSKDKTKQITQGFAAADKRVKLYDIPPSSVVEARNVASALAQGKYLAVMDADDVSSPKRLEEEIAFIQQHPEVGLVGGAAEWITGDGSSMWVLNFPTEDREIKEVLLTRSPFCHAAVLMRRDLFQQIGGYRHIFTAAHDYDLCLRLSEVTQCANLPHVVVKYRIHGSQISLSKRKLQTLYVLAAQISAASRKAGKIDPLESAREITPELLLRLGVSEASQQAGLATDYRNWIQSMTRAGEDSAALKATEEALNSNWKFVDRNQLADLNCMAAHLYWKQKSFLRGIRSAARAIVLQPVIAKHFIRPVIRRLRIV